MRYHARRFAATWFVALLATCVGCASEPARAQQGLQLELPADSKITSEEAASLVREALRPHDPRNEAALEPFDMPYSPDFYGWEALRYNPGGGAHVGSYLVNPWTGDVWEIGGCTKVQNPTLKKHQEEIRRRLQLNRQELARARSLKPFCYEAPEGN